MAEQSASVLVVDDDVDTCRNLYDILTDIGYEVAIAHDGREALELVRKRPFEVALLDLKMPGMDGLTLYREIKQTRPGTLAIVISAFINPEQEAAAYGAGCLRVLSKPIDFGTLLPLLKIAILQPTVLIVDDDHELCTNLWDLLNQQGYRVCVASTGQQAANQLREYKVDLVMLDMKLPCGDGAEVLKKIRGVDPDTCVVLITGYRQEMSSVIERALEQGAETVLYKPFEVPLLLDTVKRLVDK